MRSLYFFLRSSSPKRVERVNLGFRVMFLIRIRGMRIPNANQVLTGTLFYLPLFDLCLHFPQSNFSDLPPAMRAYLALRAGFFTMCASRPGLGKVDSPQNLHLNIGCR